MGTLFFQKNFYRSTLKIKFAFALHKEQILLTPPKKNPEK